MHFHANWYAEGLRWIAGLMQSAATRLEENVHEAREDCAGPDCVEEIRLRVHLRGL